MAAHRVNGEWIARVLLIALLTAVPAVTLAARQSADSHAVTLHARMPEDGGFMPGTLTAEVGQPLHLHLTSDDVVHGFAVGKHDAPAVDIKPGVLTELTLTFDQPGTYTYYCTRWCGANHWRMRGTIQVSGQGESVQTPQQPLYLELGFDLDAAHKSEILPSRQPAAQIGASLAQELSPDVLNQYASPSIYREQSPAQTWSQLRADPLMAGLDSSQLWDLIAWIWQANSSAENLAVGEALYTEQCAACHGRTGAGDGIMLSDAGLLAMAGEMGHGAELNADFTDKTQMLGASSAILHGKIARGGMGTGMPNWGTIYSDEQIWALVDYLWRFQFPTIEAEE